MTLPTAPVEAGGDKIIFLVTDNGGGTLVASAFRAIARAVSSDGSNALAHMGVATHVDGATWTASDPVVVLAGHDGGSPGVVRKVVVDANGRLIPRAPLLYAGPAYAEIRSVAEAAVSGIQAGWMGAATHKDGATFVQATDGVMVLAGVVQSGNAVKDLAADTSGRLSQFDGLVWAPTNIGNASIATPNTAVQLKASSTPARKVRVKAWAGNAGIIYVGGAGVTASTHATTGGIPLSAGEAIDLPLGEAGNLDAVYVNATAAGYGVQFAYLT